MNGSSMEEFVIVARQLPRLRMVPVVVYRDRSDEEIRDMSIVRYVNESWTSPKTIHADNWQIKACPVNGPRADAIGNNLAIAWFSMKDKKGEVKVVFSNDGGATFEEPIRIDEGNQLAGSICDD